MKTFASILLYDVLVCDGARCDNVNYVYSYGVTRRVSILSITSFEKQHFWRAARSLISSIFAFLLRIHNDTQYKERHYAACGLQKLRSLAWPPFSAY